MKALEILYQYKQADEAFGNSYSMGERLDEAIKELEEYESDMDSYLDYTTGSRCTKSFNSSLGSIKIAYGKELEKIIKENSEDRLAELENIKSIKYSDYPITANTSSKDCCLSLEKRITHIENTLEEIFRASAYTKDALNENCTVWNYFKSKQ